MVSNPDDSRSGDRENLPLEISLNRQSFSVDLEHMKECLQELREMQQLVRACSRFLAEDGLSYELSIRHVCLLLDMYVSNSEYCWEEIKFTITRLQQTVENNI